MGEYYKNIADGDPDPTGPVEANDLVLIVTFDTMAAETTTQSKGEHRITDLMIAAEIGEAKAHAFLDAMQADVPSRVMNWVKTTGLDINNSDVQTKISNSAYPNKAEVLAMANEVVKKYPKLRLGDLLTARILRQEGKI